MLIIPPPSNTSSTRLSHDQYFIGLLALLAARSTCVRRRVGAIIVDVDHHILGTGYNGVPRHFPHCIDEPCAGVNDPPGNTSRCMAVHAEVNAVLQCFRLDLAHTLYVTCSPCFSCTKMLCNTKIQRIVCQERYSEDTEALFLQRGIRLVIARDL